MKITHYFQKAEPSLIAAENKENGISDEERKKRMLQNGTKRVEKALLTGNRDLFVKSIDTLSRLPERYVELISNPFVQYALKKEMAMRKRAALIKNMTRQEKLQFKLSSIFEIDPAFDSTLEKFLAEKYEDTLCDLKELPEMPVIKIPEKSNVKEFEWCLHITQFLSCNDVLLRSLGANVAKIPSAELLLESLYSDRDRLSRAIRPILFALAYYLVKDGYNKEMKKLSSFANLVKSNITSDNVLKLVKFLLFRKEPSSKDTETDFVNSDNDFYFDGNENLQNALKSLKNSTHFFNMTTREILEIIQCLIDKIMLQDSFSNFITDNIYLTEALNEMKEYEAELAEVRKQLSELPPPLIDDENDVNLRTRRQGIEQARIEKLRCEKIDLLAKLESVLDEQAQYVKEMKRVNRMRILPLGVDRFHRVYWFFKDSPNVGIFIEETKEGAIENDEGESKVPKKRSKGISEFITNLEECVSGRSLTEYAKPVKTWRKVETKDLFETLCKSLCEKGIRESGLKKNLLTLADDIVKSFPRVVPHLTIINSDN